VSSAASSAYPVQVAGRNLVIVALALGTFMQVLDTTIANVSIPTIAGNLGVSSNQGTWVITSFAVANGISVPLTGWLMQRYGVVRVFVASVILFTLASLLCGLAWSLPSLIFFRILQGAVSGPMIPGSQALLMSLFPAGKKGTALGIWSMMTLVAPVCGPILGGYISDNYTWPWIFLINVPVGIFCAITCWRGLKHLPAPTRKLPIDGIGLGLLIIWVGCLQVMLDTGKDADWFQSPLIVALAFIAAVGCIVFIIWERGDKHPIIDLSLFRLRNFTIGTIALCVGYGVFFGAVVVQPLWMQTWLGYNATWAGMVAAPSGLVAMVIAPFVGRMLDKVDARWFATMAFVMFAISGFMRAGYTDDASFIAYLLPLLVSGVAMASFFTSLMTIALHGVPEEKIPSASGLMNFLRITCGALATSLVTTYWERDAARHQTQLVETIDPGTLQATMDSMTANGTSMQEAVAMLAQQLMNQAFLKSVLDLFAVSAWLSLGVIILVWMTKRPQQAHVGGGE